MGDESTTPNVNRGIASGYRLFKPVVIYSVNPDGSLRRENRMGREEVKPPSRVAAPKEATNHEGIHGKRSRSAVEKKYFPPADLFAGASGGGSTGDSGGGGTNFAPAIHALEVAVAALQGQLSSVISDVSTLTSTVGTIADQLATLQATMDTLLASTYSMDVCDDTGAPVDSIVVYIAA